MSWVLFLSQYEKKRFLFVSQCPKNCTFRMNAFAIITFAKLICFLMQNQSNLILIPNIYLYIFLKKISNKFFFVNNNFIDYLQIDDEYKQPMRSAWRVFLSDRKGGCLWQGLVTRQRRVLFSATYVQVSMS